MTENPYSTPDLEIAIPRKSSLLSKLLTAVVAVAIGLTLLSMFMPLTRNVSEVARRTQCKNNLKQIGLALYNYHNIYDAFPPAYTVDAQGQPLHSWRTLVLPYMEQQVLYDTIDLARPWNHPVNQAAFAAAQNLHLYRCPSADVPDHHTTYLGVAGPESLFNAAKSRPIGEITDGISNTLMVVEVAHDQSVPWMAPLDADGQRLLTVDEQTGFSHTGGFQAALADGSVRFLPSSIAKETLSALITINGGEPVGEF